MTTNVSSNSTANTNYDKMTTRISAPDCISWLVLLITASLAIIIFNIITIIIFVKQRQLQRQSTYLIIHLAIVDLMVGAVSAPVTIEEELGKYCGFWEFNFNTHYLQAPLRNIFAMTSLVNLAVVSLERVHATFRPFNHRFIKKWVYGVIITAMWLITILKESAKVAYYKKRDLDSCLGENFMTSPIMFICLSVICVCYISIFIKVRCSPHPINHGASSRERKLTGTLILVTIASLLSWLPYVIFISMPYFHSRTIFKLSLRPYFYIRMALIMLLGGNSLANPIVYALRVPEYRRCLRKIFRKVSNHVNPADLANGN